MQYKIITYKRIKNLGNYQSETVEMSIELDDNDIPHECFEDLKSSVLNALDIEQKTEQNDIDEIPY
ncbi:hypothetical protein [Myxosarcina sp. GI1]|uniref:hypothetical protein n=1 Tax=Myxosarcina sp. GI1 TaxID=1541065 RepID=UPI0005674A86|nr:hypothetical protein [Myxosarcina sp. GI1]